MNKATRLYAQTFGAIMALAGIEHGIGEILQGNVAPEGLMILSWPEAEFFRGLGGEPAMTVIPNLLVTGILTVIVSLALLAWSVGYAHRRYGGLVMVLLSLAMLLVGGGIFPPIFGMLVGLVATRIQAPLTWWRARLPISWRRSLAKIWPWSYALCIFSWLAAFPFGYWFGESAPLLVVLVLFSALGSLLLTIVAGFAVDLQRQATL